MILQKQKGLSLVELVIVFAIAISAFVYALRIYSEFRFQASENQIAANVDQLFQAMSLYYDANCRQHLDANSNPLSSGTLDPRITDASGVIQAVFNLNITTDLINAGFLSGFRPLNPLVDNVAAGSGYYAQFNRAIVGGRNPVMGVYACTGGVTPPACIAGGGVSLDSNQPPTLLSRVVLWRQQVAVKLSPVLTSAEWTQIRNDLRALCISSASGGGVAQCNPAPPATGYLVWERPPTHVSRSKGMQGFEPYVKQFNRQYTNDGMSILSGVPSGGWYNTQNYLCGG